MVCLGERRLYLGQLTLSGSPDDKRRVIQALFADQASWVVEDLAL
ncbi:MAG: hypothetical protein RIC87_22785 [Kiloniellales bacterium]